MLQRSFDLLFEFSDTFTYCSLAFILTNVAPCILNIWHWTCVDCIRISYTKLKKHSSIKSSAIQHLWSCLFQNFKSQVVNLKLELRPELRIRHRLEVLKIYFVFDGSHHGEAISVLEELFDHPSNSILLLYGVTIAFLGLQGALQILLLTDWIAI